MGIEEDHVDFRCKEAAEEAKTRHVDGDAVDHWGELGCKKVVVNTELRAVLYRKNVKSFLFKSKSERVSRPF